MPALHPLIAGTCSLAGHRWDDRLDDDAMAGNLLADAIKKPSTAAKERTIAAAPEAAVTRARQGARRGRRCRAEG